MKLTLERVLLAVLAAAVVFLFFQAYQFRVELEHVVSVAMVAALGWLVYAGYRAYKGSDGNWRHRLFAAFGYSATIVWARAVALFGLSLDGAAWVATVVGEPNVAAAVQNFASAKVAGSLLIGSAVITEVCRRRKASTDPVGTPTAPVAPPAQVVS